MAKKAKKTKKENPLDQIKNFSSGKVEMDFEALKEQTRKLEDLIGLKDINPFGTNDPDIFEDSLKGASLVELQSLCQKVGVFPSSSKDFLKTKLRQEFRSLTKGQRTVVIQQEMGPSNPKHPDYARLKKLLES